MNIIIQFFVDEEVFEPSATSHIMVSLTELQLKEIEFTRQLESEKIKLELKKEERQIRKKGKKEKQSEFESEKLELEKLEVSI